MTGVWLRRGLAALVLGWAGAGGASELAAAQEGASGNLTPRQRYERLLRATAGRSTAPAGNAAGKKAPTSVRPIGQVGAPVARRAPVRRPAGGFSFSPTGGMARRRLSTIDFPVAVSPFTRVTSYYGQPIGAPNPVAAPAPAPSTFNEATILASSERSFTPAMSNLGSLGSPTPLSTMPGTRGEDPNPSPSE